MSERNLVLRIVSAVVLLPVVLGLVWWREPWGFAALALVATALALVELGRLVLATAPPIARTMLVALGTAYAAAVYLAPHRAYAWTIAVVVLLGISVLCTHGELPGAVARLGATAFGIFYVGGLVPALPLMHRDLPHGSLWVIAALTVTFANDTGAYIAGRTLGRHKLAPAISPGKTIEGAVGGLLAGIGMLFALRAVLFAALAARDAVIIGTVAGVIGPAGDLLESMLKRAAGAKDSGNTIPGHGGVLDRIDALLFVGAYVYLHALYLH